MDNSLNISKNLALLIVIISYIITIPITTYIFPLKYDTFSSLYLEVLKWDLFETSIIFLICLLVNHPSLIDFYWKIVPLFQTIYIYKQIQYESNKLLVVVLVTTWGIRLFINYIRNWNGFNSLDFRVEYYKLKAGGSSALFWLFTYIIFFLVSGLLLFIAKLPILLFLTEIDTKNSDDYFSGLVVMALGIMIEKIADDQLYDFRQRKEKNKIIDEGLWYYSRHPNYLGEVLFWLGAFLLTIDKIYIYNWIIICPVFVFVVFWFGSAPWMDEHLSSKIKEYKEYMKFNRGLLLFLPRNKEFIVKND